jgi:glutaredoxin
VYCTNARRWMRERKVAFTECLIERDADCADRYRALNAPGTPVLLVRDQVLVGFSPDALREVLSPAAASSPAPGRRGLGGS